VATRTIVVASAPMRFGTHVAPDSLREVSWPDAAIPAGTYSSIAELTAGGKRIVLASIERNEPILRTKITGPGQKATLSAVIQDGMRAVTVRTNDVEGVAGFVLPGDHVDVLLTRQSERSSGMNDVVIQNARVLAVDQLADDAADRPTVARAVTLEVDTVAARKIALAASLGSLSLMLRRAGEQHMDATRRITASDLAQTEVVARSTDAKRFTKVSVTRAANKQEYNVPAEDSEWRDGAEAQAAARR
jgi:pilus assembly protein CpaB